MALSTLPAQAQPVPPPVMTNATVLPDGRAQLQVLVVPGQIYTLEMSTDLKKWDYAMMLEADTNLLTITSPEPITTSEKLLFLRTRIGRGFYPEMNLMFFAPAGSFGGALTPTVSYPVSLQNYSAGLGVDQDAPYPDATNVFFTGPPGSGLTNAAAQRAGINTNDDYAWYQSPLVSSPPVPPAGTWRVAYKGTNLSLDLPDAQVPTRFLIPVPTVTVANGVLQTVSWTYKNAATGTPLASPPAFLWKVYVQVEGFNSGGSNSPPPRLYDSDSLPPGTTTHVLATPVNWQDVNGLNMAYEDDLHNQYVIFFKTQQF